VSFGWKGGEEVYWLSIRLLKFWRSNKGKRLTIMTVPDGHGSVKTISIPVLGLYTGSTILIVALVTTCLIFFNYYSVRCNYATTFELLQKKNNQYEAVLEGSKEQREVVETLLTETEMLRERVKQLEGAFKDVNKLLEQTGKRPVPLPPLPEKQNDQVATKPLNSQYGINRLNIFKPSKTVAFAGIAFATTKNEYQPEKTEQELIAELQNEIDNLKTRLPNVEGTSTQVKGSLTKQKYDLDHTPSIWPVRGYISSSYGWRPHPVLKELKRHTGIDIAVVRGTPVKATADGRVVSAGWSGGYGILVTIDHGNGLKTLYGHNTRAIVKKGDLVKKGQVISYSGNTGIGTGDHLHYEVRKNGRDVNPANYLP